MPIENRKRVASLLPSATEIVCALGVQSDLVGVSHECDFPEGVDKLPVLTRARLKPVRSSWDIDREVREVLKNALAVYEIEMDVLERVHPDVIVTQDLCDVCAVSFDDVCSAVAKLARKDVQIVNLHPTVLADIWADIERVAKALELEDVGASVVRVLNARVEWISARASKAEHKPKVLTIEWIGPVMIGGMWMPELISLANATPMVTAPGAHAPTLSLEELSQLEPDVILIKPCGFSLPRTLEELPLLKESLPWAQWRAVREGRVFVADGNAYFNRPGPRIVDSLEILAACVHPELFADFRIQHRESVTRLDGNLQRHAFDSGL